MNLKHNILPILGGVYLVLVGDLLWKVTQSYSMWSFKPVIIFIFTSVTSYPFFSLAFDFEVAKTTAFISILASAKFYSCGNAIWHGVIDPTCGRLSEVI